MKQSDLKGLDNKVLKIYEYGCYFLDLLYISKYQEPTLEEIIKSYDTFITKGWMDEDCFIKDPCAILNYLTGKKYSVKKDSVLDSGASHIIGYYYNPSTNLHHFVVMDRYNEVKWDSITDSNTVKNGFVESYRLFKEIKQMSIEEVIEKGLPKDVTDSYLKCLRLRDAPSDANVMWMLLPKDKKYRCTKVVFLNKQ